MSNAPLEGRTVLSRDIKGVPLLGCHTCPNASQCETIQDNFRRAESHENSLRLNDRPQLRRNVSRLSDKLKQKGYRYPWVRDFSRCWLHDKWGVARYLAEESGRMLRELEDNTLVQ
jgi:hypothetical protein